MPIFLKASGVLQFNSYCFKGFKGRWCSHNRVSESRQYFDSRRSGVGSFSQISSFSFPRNPETCYYEYSRLSDILVSLHGGL